MNETKEQRDERRRKDREAKAKKKGKSTTKAQKKKVGKPMRRGQTPVPTGGMKRTGKKGNLPPRASSGRAEGRREAQLRASRALQERDEGLGELAGLMGGLQLGQNEVNENIRLPIAEQQRMARAVRRTERKPEDEERRKRVREGEPARGFMGMPAGVAPPMDSDDEEEMMGAVVREQQPQRTRNRVFFRARPSQAPARGFAGVAGVAPPAMESPAPQPARGFAGFAPATFAPPPAMESPPPQAEEEEPQAPQGRFRPIQEEEEGDGIRMTISEIEPVNSFVEEDDEYYPLDFAPNQIVGRGNGNLMELDNLLERYSSHNFGELMNEKDFEKMLHLLKTMGQSHHKKKYANTTLQHQQREVYRRNSLYEDDDDLEGGMRRKAVESDSYRRQREMLERAGIFPITKAYDAEKARQARLPLLEQVRREQVAREAEEHRRRLEEHDRS